MRFRLTTAWILAAACSLAALRTGAAQAAQQEHNALRRTIAMSAVTDEGHPVNGLLPKNLRARMGGRKIKILSCDYDTGPHRVVFLLDVSSSMDENRGFERIYAGNLLNQINLSSAIGVLTFSTTIERRVPFTSSRQTILAELENLRTVTEEERHKPLGKTALFDAIEEALKMLDPAQPGDSICIFSDGGDNASKLTDSKAKKLFSRSGVRIFTFLIVEPLPYRGRTPEEASGPETLFTLTQNTGGNYFDPDWANMEWLIPDFASRHPKQAAEQREKFVATLKSVAQPINAFYRLEIELPAPIDKPQRWKLKTYDPNARKHDPKVILHYPLRLYPAGN